MNIVTRVKDKTIIEDRESRHDVKNPDLFPPPGSSAHFLGSGERVLGNDANNVSLSSRTAESWENKGSSRQERYALRDELATFTGLERVRKCGRCARGPRIGLRVANVTGSAGWSGLTTCGSVWACPVCAAKIGARRAEEVSQVCTAAAAEGLHLSMVTLTMRHHRGQRLAALWDGLAYGWRGIVSGVGWQKAKEAGGLVGYIRSTEVTHGAAGWHVHIHVLLLSESPLNEHGLPAVMHERWARALARRGLESVKDSGGFDFSACAPGDESTMGRYVAKMGQTPEGLARETTLGPWKKARRGNRTPWQILADIPAWGDMDDLETWWEYEDASHGRRALTWSRGLRARYGLGAEQTDDEIAAEDLGTEDVLTIDAADWHRVRPHAARLLDAAERYGPSIVAVWLASRGIDYDSPPSNPRLPA